MNRIDEKFRQLRDEGQKGFIPFITAGDPDIETSLKIMLKLAEVGADVIELGVPFSDPVADGPTIQLSSQRALANGVNIEQILRMTESFRLQSDVPVVLFSYLNPILSYGLDKLAPASRKAGVDGVLVTDVIDSEAREIAKAFASEGIELISLVAPTTTTERLKAIAETARGFLYAVSRAGVTGARTEVTSEAESLVRRIRDFTDLPVAVGFGISTADQIEEVWRFADAAVVGSAIVGRIGSVKADAAVLEAERFVRSLLPEFAKTLSGP